MLVSFHCFVLIIRQIMSRLENSEFRVEEQTTCYESVLNTCGSCCGCQRAWCPCLCCWCPYPYKEVHQGYAGLKERFGKYVQSLGPGLHSINPCTQSVVEVSLKTLVMDLQRQLILTKDNITVNIDTCVYYRIVDAKVAYYTLENIMASVAEVTYATLRTFCGQNTLQDLLEKRQEISDKIEQYVQTKVKKWGVFVEQIFIKDMTITAELQADLSMTSKTQRLSKAKIISAEADVQSAKLMHQAADILNSKAAMQIRYLQILQAVSKGTGQKLLFMPLSNNEFD